MSHTFRACSGFVSAERRTAYHTHFQGEFYWLRHCNHVDRVYLLLLWSSVGDGEEPGTHRACLLALI